MCPIGTWEAEVDGSKERSQPGLDLVSKGVGWRDEKGKEERRKGARTDLCKWCSLMRWVYPNPTRTQCPSSLNLLLQGSSGIRDIFRTKMSQAYWIHFCCDMCFLFKAAKEGKRRHAAATCGKHTSCAAPAPKWSLKRTWRQKPGSVDKAEPWGTLHTRAATVCASSCLLSVTVDRLMGQASPWFLPWIWVHRLACSNYLSHCA